MRSSMAEPKLQASILYSPRRSNNPSFLLATICWERECMASIEPFFDRWRGGARRSSGGRRADGRATNRGWSAEECPGAKHIFGVRRSGTESTADILRGREASTLDGA